MQHFLLQLHFTGLPGQAPVVPELPPGPSLDRVRGPIEIPLLEPWQTALILVLGMVAIGLFVWQFRLYLAKCKQLSSPFSPYDAAIAELKTAAELTAHDDERFAVHSSLALRRYFETGKGIDALGRTTDEFLNSIRTHSILNAEARNSLAKFLDHCDRVKFAKASFTEKDRQALTISAVTLIQQCEEMPCASTAANVRP